MSKTSAHKPNREGTKALKSKSEQVIGLLSRPSGASIAEMVKCTGWQSHSVRGFLAGSLKKKGHPVSGELDGKGVRRYRLDVPVKS